jgi:geranylgeranyl pyrophosphate synthase
MTELRDQAMALLEATPDTKAKTALIDLVDYTIERKR